jgi:Na+/proline symporter
VSTMGVRQVRLRTMAIVAGFVSATAYLGSVRLTSMARLGDAPIKDIEDRLAKVLNINSLQMVERHRGTRRTDAKAADEGARRLTPASFIIPFIAIAFCLAAALYAWLPRHHA